MAKSTSRQQYIDQYAEYAMEQMRRYGIPASVTLAQGIIESANGKSTLAETANNHFGVKGTFNGAYVVANDDKPNEKFKKYDNVGQSYEDHSKVLMASRYQKYVSSLSPDDYKGWAAGIKKGGYATDSNYVSTIVGVIEGNNLQKYDQMVMEQMKREGRQFGVASNPLSAASQGNPSTLSTSLKRTGFDLAQGQYSMPVSRDVFMLVTSPYGPRKDPMDRTKTQIHHGIDIKTNSDAVLATENNGTIVAVNHNTNTGSGKSVTVEYSRADGSATRVQYMHLSQINVQKGDSVNAGQKLGVSGNTGSRTTGEHLHLGVINVSADGKQQWVNPAAYLSEINQKGNLQKQAQYNGKDLLAQYQAGGSTTMPSQSQEQASPDDWMSRLMSSDDAALGYGQTGSNGNDGGLLDSIMKMFMTMLMLTMQMENKTQEEKVQMVTDALVNKRIDLSGFTPNMQSSALTIKQDGTAVLTTDDGKQQYSHELTTAEQTRLSQILNSDADYATKQQRIGTMVYTITFAQQASQNYEQIATQQQSQEQTIQRK
ncbi:MAG: glucosaminidase domain-containing protein [Bacteroidaceae bacterium]|nr:glucosaminidase domain-containing protein [Bacteroidaceae bacterium]